MTDDEIREYLQHGTEVCHDMINVMPNAIAHRQKHLGIIDRLDQKDARIAALTEELERVKGLVHHMWIHAGYKDSGYEYMTTAQKEHMNALLKEPT